MTDNVDNQFMEMAGEPIPQVITENAALIDQVHQKIAAIRPGSPAEFPGMKSLSKLSGDMIDPDLGDDELREVAQRNIDKSFEDGTMDDLIEASLEGELDRDDIEAFAQRMLTPDSYVSDMDNIAQILNREGVGGNATTELATVLKDPDFAEYQEKFGDLIAQHPIQLLAPTLFTSSISSYFDTAAYEDVASIVKTLSQSELFMTCLDSSEYLQGTMMNSLSYAQVNPEGTGASIEERVALFEAAAESGILGKLMNAKNVDSNLEIFDEDDLGDDYAVDPEQRHNLVMFLGCTFYGETEEAALEVLQKTDALKDLRWGDDVESWATGGADAGKALLEVCKSNREAYLANKPEGPKDDTDFSQS